ncbi:MAG: hypothetical protein ACHRXM_22275 [Isosphaerales bacterium]
MRQPEILDVDPRELRRLPSQACGADPFKLQTQVARFGASTDGMPPPWVYRGSDGALVLYNGVTRATRVAKLASGALIQVEVVGELKRPVGHYPKIGDTLP